MTRRHWWFVGIVALLLAAWIHPGFFFNPLTFHKDDVTYLPWSWYKSPLRLEYVDQSTTQVRMRTLDDQAEVRHAFAELKKGLGAPQGGSAQPGKPFVVAIRLAPDGYDVLFVYGTIGSNAASLGNDKGRVPVLLTDDLRRLVEQRLAEASTPKTIGVRPHPVTPWTSRGAITGRLRTERRWPSFLARSTIRKSPGWALVPGSQDLLMERTDLGLIRQWRY